MDQDLHHANSRTPLEKVNWDKDRQAKTHPFRVRVTQTTIYNHETGEVVATAAPGYEFYYAHNHPHIAPVGYDTASAIAAVDGVKTQIAKPASGGIGKVLGAAVAARTLSQTLATSKKGSL